MAIADSDYKNITVGNGGYGSTSDGGIFVNTTFHKRLCKGQVTLTYHLQKNCLEMKLVP